ncbi:MAG: hypothetical protein IKD17_02690 [Alistipes sp.]|nr:hypothetical protein [Alistipes sp.]
MRTVFTYRIDRRTLYWTLLYVVVYLGLAIGLYYLYEGEYLSAWFISCVGALLILMALSIPRKIIIDADRVEVRCLLDITEVERAEIASVRRVSLQEMRRVIPIFGGCGFFGYYGHFFDLKHFERIRIYASEWRNIVEITDIYEERLWVSASDPDALIEALTPTRK